MVKTYVFLFHLISFVRLCTSFESIQGLFSFLGTIRPSPSRLMLGLLSVVGLGSFAPNDSVAAGGGSGSGCFNGDSAPLRWTF